MIGWDVKVMGSVKSFGHMKMSLSVFLCLLQVLLSAVLFPPPL